MEKVKPEAGKVTVSFKKESWIEAVMDCKETNRIDRIWSDGTIVYRQICKQVGTRTVTNQEKPVTVDASAADGIKAGTFLVFLRDGGDATQGLPAQVYTDESRKQLISFFGIN